MGKDFKQHIADMENSIHSLKMISKKDSISSYKYKQIILRIKIQEESINYFKSGYNLAYNEIREQTIINPFSKGCGRDIETELKGCVYCGDSEGYFCDSCKFIKKLISSGNIISKDSEHISVDNEKQEVLK